VPLPGAGANPFGGGVPLPGAGGGVPLPGAGANPFGGGVPLPGAGGGVPLPGAGANPFGDVAPGGGDAGGNPFDALGIGTAAPGSQTSSLSDIFGSGDGNSATDSVPSHPFHGQDTYAGVGARPETNDDELAAYTSAGRSVEIGTSARYRIRRRGAEPMGPFDEETMRGMCERQELAGNEEASTDGQTWKPLSQYPVFKESIAKAMSAALSGIDLPGLRGGLDLPGLKASPSGDAEASGLEGMAPAATASMGLPASVLARRKRAKQVRMATAVLGLGLVGGGAALEFTPHGAFLWRHFVPEEPPPMVEVKKEEGPPPAPELPKPTVPANQLMKLDHYVAFRQGLESYGKVLELAKEVQPVPPTAQKAAAEMSRFLAYLIAVEELPTFAAEMDKALPFTVPGDLGRLLGETAIAYQQKRFDDGLKPLEPLTDEAKGLEKNQLAEVLLWIGMGQLGRGEPAVAQQSIDRALQQDPNHLTALWLQAVALARSGEVAAALGYADKVLELAPEHPRASLVKADLLLRDPKTRAQGAELMTALTEGPLSTNAGPQQKAKAYMARAELAMGARAWSDALQLASKAVGVLPHERSMRFQQAELALKMNEFGLAQESYRALADTDPSDTRAIIGLARAKTGARDVLGSYSDLQAAVAKHPQSAPLHFWFGRTAANLMKLEESARLIQKARELDPQWAEPAVEQILERAELGRLKDALELTREAEANTDPTQRSLLRAAKGAVLTRLRKYPQARKELTAAIAEAPKEVEARIRLVELATMMGNVEEADLQAKEALHLDPKNPRVIAAAAVAESAQNNHKRALELFDEAIAIAPNDYRPYLYATAAAIEVRDFGRAKSFIDAAGQLKPKSPEVLARRGEVLRTTDPKQAVQVLSEAMELSPDDPHLPYELGYTFHRMGLNLEARDAYQRAIALDPAFADAFFGKGVALRELGRTSEAVSTFKEVTRLEPKRADAHVQLAEMLSTQGDPKGAIKAYRNAIQADPGSSVPVCEMGLMLVQSLGNEQSYLKQGVGSLEDCVKRDPKHRDANRKLGDAYRDMRRPKDAIAAYRAHVEQNPDDPNNSLVCESLSLLGSNCD
ncbi:MAG: tetratricopeptide repeat protein, partial [Myxococcota bacterium]